jgi:YggT family protein
MSTIVQIVTMLLNALALAIFIRALLSWFMPVGRDPITRFLVDVTDPILQPIRNLTSNLIPGMMIDFSPIIAIIVLQLLAGMVARVA